MDLEKIFNKYLFDHFRCLTLLHAMDTQMSKMDKISTPLVFTFWLEGQINRMVVIAILRIKTDDILA